MHFKIHGQGKKNLNGDGFAIWYTKDRMQPGERSGTLSTVPGAGRAASGALCGIATLWGPRGASPSCWQAKKGVTAVGDAWCWGLWGPWEAGACSAPFCLARGVQSGAPGSVGLQLVRDWVGGGSWSLAQHGAGDLTCPSERPACGTKGLWARLSTQGCVEPWSARLCT